MAGFGANNGGGFGPGNSGFGSGNGGFGPGNGGFGFGNGGFGVGGTGEGGLVKPIEVAADESKNLINGKQALLNCQYEQAIETFKRACADNEAKAFYFVGIMLAEGLGCQADMDQAKYAWQSGVELGDKLCWLRLATPEEYFDFQQSEEAQNLVAEGRSNIFVGFEIAKQDQDQGGFLMDQEQRDKYFDAAAKEGFCLGMFYMYKSLIGLGKYDEALYNLRQAAEVKRYPQAMLEIGDLFKNGINGVSQNDQEALRWYKQAELARCVKASYLLGNFYYERQQFNYALPYLARAAHVGDVAAMVQLGYMYMDGSGTPGKRPDFAKAKRMFEAAQPYNDQAREGLEELAARAREEAAPKQGKVKVIRQAGYSRPEAAPAPAERNNAGGFGAPAERITAGGFGASAERTVSGGFGASVEMTAAAESGPVGDITQEIYDVVGNINAALGIAVPTRPTARPAAPKEAPARMAAQPAPQEEAPVSRFANEIKSMKASRVSHREAAKKLVMNIAANTSIPCWSIYPKIDNKSISIANSNYAGKNFAFDVMAIFDDGLAVFKNKLGFMVTIKAIITSQGFTIPLDTLVNVEIRPDNIIVFTYDGNKVDKYRSKKPLLHGELVKELLLSLALLAREYKN